MVLCTDFIRKVILILLIYSNSKFLAQDNDFPAFMIGSLSPWYEPLLLSLTE